MSDEPSYGTKRWTKHFEEIDLQISRLALMMDIRILDPGVIDRILKNDTTVCGKHKPKAFEELRGMLQMHANDQVKAMGALGSLEAQAMVRQVADRLRERLGDRMGNRQEPPSA